MAIAKMRRDSLGWLESCQVSLNGKRSLYATVCHVRFFSVSLERGGMSDAPWICEINGLGHLGP